MTAKTWSRWMWVSAAGLAALGVTVAMRGRVIAASSGQEPVTYAKNVAPILQQKCQVCHSPNSIAPMSLLTYDDAKKYARGIKNKVSDRLMPPWYIDKTVGIQKFKNDRSLTDARDRHDRPVGRCTARRWATRRICRRRRRSPIRAAGSSRSSTASPTSC